MSIILPVQAFFPHWLSGISKQFSMIATLYIGLCVFIFILCLELQWFFFMFNNYNRVFDFTGMCVCLFT